MTNVFYGVLPIFLIAVLGSVIRRKWLKSDEFWRGLEKLSFYILFPTVLFKHSLNIDFNAPTLIKLTIALIISNLIISGLLVFYQSKFDYDKVQFTSVFQGATRYNSYIFFSVGGALFGSDGLTIIATISPYLLTLTNITAIMVFYYYLPKNDDMSTMRGATLLVKSIILNPFILASLLGFIFNYFKFTLNIGIANTLGTIADSAFAIGMLIVGASIKIKIDPKHFQHIFLTSGVKLAITPIATFLILWLMNITGTAKSVGILFSCLPCASSSYILSRQLGGDPETMSSIITFTTIFSILSLSILVYILG
ncbi:MAG: AEC family transporter [Rickettsiales bacterium]|nr:MAG: AEC family transporter [Rickettsiales bacterium]